jgi:hypothetical protein
MEEVAAKRPEEVRPPTLTSEPHEAQTSISRAHLLSQFARNKFGVTDSTSIEEERVRA